MENWNFAQWLNWFSPVLSVEDASFIPSRNCTQPLIVTRRARCACARGSVPRILLICDGHPSCVTFLSKYLAKNSDNWKLVETSGISQRWWMYMSLLRRLFAGPSLLRPGFDPGPVSVMFMADTVTVGQIFLRARMFPPVSMLHTHSFTYHAL